MALCLSKIVVVKNAFYHTVIKTDKFEKHFTVLNMVALIVVIVSKVVGVSDTFFERCVTEGYELTCVLVLLVVKS